MNRKERVYLSLGSNMGARSSLIVQAVSAIADLADVELIATSSLYNTSPVSPIPQRDFINAVCALDTTLTAHALYRALHQIEHTLGKRPKRKDAPRPIDIDILFFGMHLYRTPELCIPHPRWKERLFVLAPLAELVEEITFPIETGCMETLNVKKFLLTFSNPHNESVSRCIKPANIPSFKV